jgi:hypothetical protein
MRPGSQTWQSMRATLNRGREAAARASSHARQRGRELGQRLTPRAQNVAQTTRAKITAGGPGRWVRAVDGELVNLDGCDYVAVERERGGSCVVVARMHGGAANWVLARYERHSDATRAMDWLAGHLEAWRLDLVAAADSEGDSGTGQATE